MDTVPSRHKVIAVLDSACTHSICSLDWFNLYSDFLWKLKGMTVALSDPSDQNFVFANGTTCKSDFSASIPIFIGSCMHYITVAVFRAQGTHNPLLLGKPDMGKFGLVIDTGNNCVSSLTCNLDNHPLIVNASGHLCITVFHNPDKFQGGSFSVCAARIESLSDKEVLRLHRQKYHMLPQKLCELLKSGNFTVNSEQVHRVVRNCPDCRHKQRLPKIPKSGGFIAKGPNHVWSMDLFEVKSNAHSYLVCHFMDIFSRYSYADIIPNKEASTTLSVLARFGALVGTLPKRLWSDNGKEFDNSLWRDYCAFQNVKLKLIVPKHAHSNGIIERRHKYVKSMFQNALLELSRLGVTKGSLVLAETIRVVNSIPSSTTGYSPCYLYLGIQPEIVMYDDSKTPSQLNDISSYSDFVQQRIAIHSTILKIAFGNQCRKSILSSLKPQMFSTKEYSIGDEVFAYIDGSHRGPFTVIGRDGNQYNIRQGGYTTWANGYDMVSMNNELPEELFDSDEVVQDAGPGPSGESGGDNPQVKCTTNISESDILKLHTELNHCSVAPLQARIKDILGRELSTSYLTNVLSKCGECTWNHLVSADWTKLHVSDSDRTCTVCSQIVPKVDYFNHCIHDCPDNPAYREGPRNSTSSDNPHHIEFTPDHNAEFEYTRCPECNMDVEVESFDIHRDLFCNALTTHQQPSSKDIEENLAGFIDSRLSEIHSWINNGVFSTVSPGEVPEGSNVISSRCVETLKLQPDGTRKPKTRIVLRGFQDKQKDSLFIESPTVSKVAVRMTIQYAVDRGYSLHSVDIKTAFLQGKPFAPNDNRIVYAKPPTEILQVLGRPQSDELWLMKKPAYGLADAPYRWYLSLRDKLLSYGLVLCKLDSAVFIYRKDLRTLGLLCIHVDDILYASSNAFRRDIIDRLQADFTFGSHEVHDFKYCGTSISRLEDKSIAISQYNYISSLNRLDIPRSKHPDASLNAEEYTAFRHLLGCLMWISVCSRPDIAFGVNELSHSQNNPTVSDARLLNKLLRGLQYRSNLPLQFRPLKEKELVALADSSYAAHSTQGHLFFFSSPVRDTSIPVSASLIDWNSKKIRRVTRSTCTAECIAVCNAIDQSVFLSSLWQDMSGEKLSIRVYNDSRNLIHLCHNSKIPEEKRLAIELAYLRENLSDSTVKSIEHIDTSILLADSLTKSRSSAFPKLIEFMKRTTLHLSKCNVSEEKG